MPFCANCGAKVGDNDKFCGSCGATRVPAAQESPAAVPPPPQPQYQPPPQAQYQPPPQNQTPPPAYGQPTGGYQQPGMQYMGQPQANAGDSSTGMKANIAGLLCYVMGWLTGIVFLIIEKNSKFVRFHAAQSIVVFGILSILGIILNVLPWNWFFTLLSALVGLVTFILWLVLMYKAYQGEEFKVPVLGDIARGIAGK